MLISHSKKFVFIHVPKTGGTSILGALAPYGDRWREGTKIKDVKGWQMRHHSNPMHSGLDSNPEIKEQCPGYFTFGFVRNPWDRIISIYAKIGLEMPLLEFLKALEKNLSRASKPIKHKKMKATASVHYVPKPLHTWLEINGKGAVGFVGRFENFEEDFLKCQWLIGLKEPINLPHYNPGKHKPYQEYYDDRTIEIVARMYKEDIKRYGYTF